MLVIVVTIVLLQTKIGTKPELNYQNDPALPLIQATGGPVFDLRSVDLARSRANMPSATNSSNANTTPMAK